MTKSNVKHRVHVILSVSQYNTLKAASDLSGVPISEIMRRATDATLAKGILPTQLKASKVPTPKQVKDA